MRVNVTSSWACIYYVCLRCWQYISFSSYAASSNYHIWDVSNGSILFPLHCTGDFPFDCVMILIHKSFNLFPAVHQCNFECFVLKGWWIHYLLFLICQIHKMKNSKRIEHLVALSSIKHIVPIKDQSLLDHWEIGSWYFVEYIAYSHWSNMFIVILLKCQSIKKKKLETTYRNTLIACPWHSKKDFFSK